MIYNSNTKSTLKQVLSVRNKHPRDKYVLFDEFSHTYNVIYGDCFDKKFTSVTTFIATLFPKFNPDEAISKMQNKYTWNENNKYWGMTPDEIKELWNKNREDSAAIGTYLHHEIECFYNNDNLEEGYTNKELFIKFIETDPNLPEENYSHIEYSDDLWTIKNTTKNRINYSLSNKDLFKNTKFIPEWLQFMQLIRDKPSIKPYRTEWKIWHEDIGICGSIDFVCENDDGTHSLLDWKRTHKDLNPQMKYKSYFPFGSFACNPIIGHMPNNEYSKYSLQLNLYKYILESKYGLKIKDMTLVKFHPDNSYGNYELIPVEDLSEEINDLVASILSE